MPEFASELLRTLVRKKPERVWDALTSTGIPLGYLYGMTVESDWRPGTSVTMTLGDQARLTGDVLVAERPAACRIPSAIAPGSPRFTSTGSYAPSATRRSCGCTSMSHGQMPTRPTTSKRPGFRYFTTWLPILTGVPGDFRQIGIYRIRRSSGSQGCPCRAGRRPLHRPAERGHVQPSGHGPVHLAKRLANLYAAMPQPARRLGPRGPHRR